MLSRKRRKPARNHIWRNWDAVFLRRKKKQWIHWSEYSVAVENTKDAIAEEIADGEFEVKCEFAHPKLED